MLLSLNKISENLTTKAIMAILRAKQGDTSQISNLEALPGGSSALQDAAQKFDYDYKGSTPVAQPPKIGIPGRNAPIGTSKPVEVPKPIVPGKGPAVGGPPIKAPSVHGFPLGKAPVSAPKEEKIEKPKVPVPSTIGVPTLKRPPIPTVEELLKRREEKLEGIQQQTSALASETRDDSDAYYEDKPKKKKDIEELEEEENPFVGDMIEGPPHYTPDEVVTLNLNGLTEYTKKIYSKHTAKAALNSYERIYPVPNDLNGQIDYYNRFADNLSKGNIFVKNNDGIPIVKRVNPARLLTRSVTSPVFFDTVSSNISNVLLGYGNSLPPKTKRNLNDIRRLLDELGDAASYETAYTDRTKTSNVINQIYRAFRSADSETLMFVSRLITQSQLKAKGAYSRGVFSEAANKKLIDQGSHPGINSVIKPKGMEGGDFYLPSSSALPRYIERALIKAEEAKAKKVGFKPLSEREEENLKETNPEAYAEYRDKSKKSLLTTDERDRIISKTKIGILTKFRTKDDTLLSEDDFRKLVKKKEYSDLGLTYPDYVKLFSGVSEGSTGDISGSTYLTGAVHRDNFEEEQRASEISSKIKSELSRIDEVYNGIVDSTTQRQNVELSPVYIPNVDAYDPEGSISYRNAAEGYALYKKYLEGLVAKGVTTATFHKDEPPQAIKDIISYVNVRAEKFATLANNKKEIENKKKFVIDLKRVLSNMNIPIKKGMNLGDLYKPGASVEEIAEALKTAYLRKSRVKNAIIVELAEYLSGKSVDELTSEDWEHLNPEIEDILRTGQISKGMGNLPGLENEYTDEERKSALDTLNRITGVDLKPSTVTPEEAKKNIQGRVGNPEASVPVAGTPSVPSTGKGPAVGGHPIKAPSIGAPKAPPTSPIGRRPAAGEPPIKAPSIGAPKLLNSLKNAAPKAPSSFASGSPLSNPNIRKFIDELRKKSK